MCERERVLDMETKDNTHFCETCNCRHPAYRCSEKCVLGHQKYFTTAYFESFSFVESRISNINCSYVNIPNTTEAFLVITYDEKNLNGFNVFTPVFYRHVQQPNKLSDYTEIPRILTKWVERYASTAKQFDKCNPEEELWAKFEAEHIHFAIDKIFSRDIVFTVCDIFNVVCYMLFGALIGAIVWIFLLCAIGATADLLHYSHDEFQIQLMIQSLPIFSLIGSISAFILTCIVSLSPIGSYRRIKESTIPLQEYKRWARRFKENWIFKTSLSNGDLV